MRCLMVKLLLLLIAVSAFGQPRMSKTTLLKVIGPDVAWAESRLSDKLQVALSRSGHIDIRQVEESGTRTLPFPSEFYHLDSLVAWGQEVGGRYLLLVVVDREELERRKGWKLPLILHRWETIGVISGELRLVDLARRRYVVAESFDVEMTAKAVFQSAIDDDPGDPDIKLSATEKVRFFSDLEDRLCSIILSRLPRLTGGQ